jgi:hypothetical protein
MGVTELGARVGGPRQGRERWDSGTGYVMAADAGEAQQGVDAGADQISGPRRCAVPTVLCSKWSEQPHVRFWRGRETRRQAVGTRRLAAVRLRRR